MIYKQITELVGRTPLLELCNYEKDNKLEAKIIAKMRKSEILKSRKN